MKADTLEQIVRAIGPTYICPSCHTNPTHRKGALCYECAPAAEITRLHRLMHKLLMAADNVTRTNGHAKKAHDKAIKTLRQAQESVQKALGRHTPKKTRTGNTKPRNKDPRNTQPRNNTRKGAAPCST